MQIAIKSARQGTQEVCKEGKNHANRNNICTSTLSGDAQQEREPRKYLQNLPSKPP